MQGELYVLLYANSSWYLFIRLYHMFCQRLHDIRRVANTRQRESCGSLESSCMWFSLSPFCVCLRIALASDWRNMLWNVFAIVVSTLISHAKRSYRHS